MTFSELLKSCIDSFNEIIDDVFHDSDFDVYTYIENMNYIEDIMSVIDMNVPIYNIDLIDVFRSENDLWYMEDEFDGENLLDNIRGVITMKLHEDLCQWWSDEGEEQIKRDWKEMKEIFENE